MQATAEFNRRLEDSSSKARWDAIAVVDEFRFLDEDFKDDLIVHERRFWGDNFFGDKEGGQLNFFVCEVSKHARYAVPSVRHLCSMAKAK